MLFSPRVAARVDGAAQCRRPDGELGMPDVPFFAGLALEVYYAGRHRCRRVAGWCGATVVQGGEGEGGRLAVEDRRWK